MSDECKAKGPATGRMIPDSGRVDLELGPAEELTPRDNYLSSASRELDSGIVQVEVGPDWGWSQLGFQER